MSIQAVQRSLHALRYSLETSSINVDAPAEMARPARYRELDVLYLVHDVMEQCPELVEVSLESDVRTSHSPFEADEETVWVGASLTFEFLAGGRQFRFWLRPDESADAKIEKIMDEVCESIADDIQRARLDQQRDSINRILNDFDDNRGSLHDVEVWRHRGKLVVAREAYLASMVAGVFDPDRFRALVLDQDPSVVAGPQGDLAGAPYFWNKASVRTMAVRLDSGMDPGACDVNGVSPLVAACVYGDTPAIALLLEAGADPDRVDGTGQNAVTAAFAAGNIPTFEYLVGKGANPNGPAMSPTVLVAIALDNGLDLLKQCVRSNIDLGQMMPDGKPFYPGTERFLPGSKPFEVMRRQEFIRLITSVATERTVTNAIAPGGLYGSARQSKGLVL